MHATQITNFFGQFNYSELYTTEQHEGYNIVTVESNIGLIGIISFSEKR